MGDPGPGGKTGAFAIEPAQPPEIGTGSRNQREDYLPRFDQTERFFTGLQQFLVVCFSGQCKGTSSRARAEQCHNAPIDHGPADEPLFHWNPPPACRRLRNYDTPGLVRGYPLFGDADHL